MIRPIKLSISLLLVLSVIPTAQAQQQEVKGEVNQAMHRSSIDRLVGNFESEGRAEWQKPDEVIRLFGDISNKTIMDLGAGSGYFTFRLAEKADRVIAADVDDRFLDYLKEKLADQTDSLLKSRIEIRKIPYDDPGLRSGEVEGVIMVNTYHHIENRTDYFERMLSGLKTDGQLMVVDFKLGNDFGPPDNHKLSFKTVIDELSAVGFNSITSDTTLLPYQYIILCTK